MEKTKFCGGHLGFLAAILKIFRGPNQFLVLQGLDYNCAKFHASFQKRTVLPFSPIKQANYLAQTDRHT